MGCLGSTALAGPPAPGGPTRASRGPRRCRGVRPLEARPVPVLQIYRGSPRPGDVHGIGSRARPSGRGGPTDRPRRRAARRPASARPATHVPWTECHLRTPAPATLQCHTLSSPLPTASQWPPPSAHDDEAPCSAMCTSPFVHANRRDASNALDSTTCTRATPRACWPRWPRRGPATAASRGRAPPTPPRFGGPRIRCTHRAHPR